MLAHRRRRRRAHMFCQGLTQSCNYQLARRNEHHGYTSFTGEQIQSEQEQDTAYGNVFDMADRRLHPPEDYGAVVVVKKMQPVGDYGDIVPVIQRRLREVLEQLARELIVA